LITKSLRERAKRHEDVITKSAYQWKTRTDWRQPDTVPSDDKRPKCSGVNGKIRKSLVGAMDPLIL